eukprot:s275_g22.t1
MVCLVDVGGDSAGADGDGDVLEQVLEDNLEIRKEINALIQELQNAGCFGGFGLNVEPTMTQVLTFRSKAFCNSSAKPLASDDGCAELCLLEDSLDRPRSSQSPSVHRFKHIAHLQSGICRWHNSHRHVLVASRCFSLQ